MKTRLFSTVLTLLFISLFYLPNTNAQDYSTWKLPDDAKARLGKGVIHGIAHAPNGERLAVATSIGIWMYDTNTGKEVDLLTQQPWVLSVAFSPDEQILASSNWHDIRLWDAETGEVQHTLTGHSDDITKILFSPDGQTLVSASWDSTIRLWDVETGEVQRTLTGHSGRINSIALSSDGRTLASGSADKTIRLWDMETGATLHTLTGHTLDVFSIALSSDGQTLASCGGGIRVWDTATGNLRQTIQEWVESIALSPDGETLLIAQWDGNIEFMDLENP